MGWRISVVVGQGKGIDLQQAVGLLVPCCHMAAAYAAADVVRDGVVGDTNSDVHS